MRPKNRVWLAVFGFVSIFLLLFMLSLAYALRIQTNQASQGGTPTATHTSIFRLPTAPLATSPLGLPFPQQIHFIAEDPIKGFSNCEIFGFTGMVQTEHDTLVDAVQIAVWDNYTGLLALAPVDAKGKYLIELNEQLAQHNVSLQIYENDLPVSQPVVVQPHTDCENGFQVFEINWHEVDTQ